MSENAPIIRLAYSDDDGELQLMGAHSIQDFGCVPAVGDILRDTLVEWCEAFRVRRRVFIQMAGEPSVWWVLVDRLPDDPEVDALVAFDAEIRQEFKKLDDEERSDAFERVLARARASTRD